VRKSITTKAQMYRQLVAGDFGNTIPRWFTIREWEEREMALSQKLWGVQHASIPGFPGTRLNVPTNQVAALVVANGFGENYVISPMVSEWGKVVWEGNVARLVGGIFAEGHFNPEPGSWRQHMLNPYQWRLTKADLLLKLVLNENSYDDLMVLLDEYPDHVVEFSAMEGCYGTVPNRNSIVWEVRQY
jgi:hypothetical protein